MDETKVIYYVDDEETPYLMKIQLPPDKITLSHFKNALNKPNCKYFFKSMDDDFGVVKEEIADDEVLIPCLGGRVVSWLISKEVSEKSDNETAPHASHGIASLRNELSVVNDDNVASSGYQTSSSQQPSSGGHLSRPSPKCHRRAGGASSTSSEGGERHGRENTHGHNSQSQQAMTTGEERSQQHMKMSTVNADRGGETAAAPLANSLGDGDAEDGLLSAGGSRGMSGKSHHHHNHSNNNHQQQFGLASSNVDNASVQSSDIDSTSFFDSEDESSRFSTATGTTMSSFRYHNRHRRQKRRHRMPAAISRPTFPDPSNEEEKSTSPLPTPHNYW